MRNIEKWNHGYQQRKGVGKLTLSSYQDCLCSHYNKFLGKFMNAFFLSFVDFNIGLGFLPLLSS